MYEPSKIFTAPEPVERVFTPDLKGLCDWLETQDGSTKYNHMSWPDCLLCRFHFVVSGKRADWKDIDSSLIGRDERLWDVACPLDEESTYRAALSRARQALTEAKP